MANARDWQPARRDGIPPWWPAGPHLDHLADQPGRHEVSAHGAHPGRRGRGIDILIGLTGQRHQGGPVDGLEKLPAAGAVRIRRARRPARGWRRARRRRAGHAAAPVPSCASRLSLRPVPGDTDRAWGKARALEHLPSHQTKGNLGGLLKVQGRHGCGGWGVLRDGPDAHQKQ